MAFEIGNKFDPVLLTLDENRFLLDHLGEPPIVALSKGVPSGVSATVIKTLLAKVYELEELREHDGTSWAGIPALKDKINVYIEQAEKWANERRRGAPRFPSMYSYDGKGRPHLGGTGSDSGKVSSYFDSNGNRIPFAIDWYPSEVSDWRPDWAKADEPVLGLKVNTAERRIECQICGHTEQFNPDSRGSFNVARARMSKHLKSATIEVDKHREVLASEF